jgi:electron transport complex protein RnfB
METGIIITAVALTASAGALVALGLGYAARRLAVHEDPRVARVKDVLPGANCGACGYVGCAQYAEALVAGTVDTGLCKPGGPETARAVAVIVGRSAGDMVRTVAQVLCAGGTRCANEFEYRGVPSCAYAAQVARGQKMCKYGCLGFGDCVKVCPFNALHINGYGVAEVDVHACTGCGLCVAACPMRIITLVPCTYQVHIRCSSHDKGALVRRVCSVGCIGCGLCVKACPVNDIHLERNLAVMQYRACDNCGACVAKCPTKCIQGPGG